MRCLTGAIGALAVFTANCTAAQQPAAALHPDTTITYAVAGSPDQTLDLFLPKASAAKFVTVVFTYGGGWHAPRGPNVGRVCEAFRGKGYACALLKHRLAPEHPFPAAEQDEALAVGWVLDNIVRFGGDRRQVILVGHSSGAHLAVLIASDPAWLGAIGHRPLEIAAVVGLSTPTDLTPAADGRGYGDALLGGRGADAFSRDTAVLRRASPVTFADRPGPPILLVVGADDFPMLERDAQAFVTARRHASGVAELMLAAGRGHGGAVGAIVESDNPVLSRVLAFLRAHHIVESPVAR